MTELKVAFEEVRAKLEALDAKAASLDASAPGQITGNTLDTADSLNELMTYMEQMLTRYRVLLQQNVMTSEESINFLADVDRQLATAISGTGNEPKPV